MKKHWKAAPVAAALLAGCGGSKSSGSPAASSDDAWLDTADVVVAVDAAKGRETVTLVDPSTGQRLVVSDEPFTTDVIEQEDET